MSRFVTDETTTRITEQMFQSFGSIPEEIFLRQELVRYVPQLVGASEEQIADFIAYQRQVYLENCPEIGRPIASLNPKFVASLDAISFKRPGCSIYTRASIKENGYRFQLHRGQSQVKAFTRQFTPYDLRMFPELFGDIHNLPLIIGDCELVNANHRHLAGFNRVQIRFPDMRFWPKRQSQGLISDELLAEYLRDPELFNEGLPLEDFKLALVFHGLYAIADQSTWGLPLEQQADNMINLCQLPINYWKIDVMLGWLKEYLEKRELKQLSVFKYLAVANHEELEGYIKANDASGEEGTCVVQSIRKLKNPLGTQIMAPHGVKFKKYETVDAALLGLYLHHGTELVPENVAGGLLGIFDHAWGCYLPAMKVNFDELGRQIKNDDQRLRLRNLVRQIIALTQSSDIINPNGKIVTLYDIFLKEGNYILGQLLNWDGHADEIETMLGTIPRGQDLLSLIEYFQKNRHRFSEGKKWTTATERFIGQNSFFFQEISCLPPKDQRRLIRYFGKAKNIKVLSAKLPKPQIIFDTAQPVIMEAKVFDAKWGNCPFPAGFHGWYTNSFLLTNCFADHIRFDKSDTTDSSTIHELCRRFTVKKSKRSKR